MDISPTASQLGFIFLMWKLISTDSGKLYKEGLAFTVNNDYFFWEITLCAEFKEKWLPGWNTKRGDMYSIVVKVFVDGALVEITS